MQKFFSIATKVVTIAVILDYTGLVDVRSLIPQLGGDK